MNNLLIISCSQRKIESPETLAALDRYDGPTYRSLRKARREGRVPKNLDVVIISAKYGLLTCQQPVDTYNQKMTTQRAAELEFEVQSKLRSFMRAKPGGYDEVFINLGSVYRQTLEGFHWGLTRTLEASGGIGLRTLQMKAWVMRCYQAERIACETKLTV